MLERKQGRFDRGLAGKTASGHSGHRGGLVRFTRRSQILGDRDGRGAGFSRALLHRRPLRAAPEDLRRIAQAAPEEARSSPILSRYMPSTINLFLAARSEEHTSALQSLMRHSYAVFCLKKKKKTYHTNNQYKITN